MMKQIQLIITALSPLAIGRKKPGSVSEAEDYIPGSVIRGAIASEILKQSDSQNADLVQNGGDFQSLFLGDRAAIFGNAYPTSENNKAEVSVLPATAVSAKVQPGFTPKGNGVFDTLIDRFCAQAYNYLYDPTCPKALVEGNEGRVEPYGGFYSQVNGKYQSHSVTKRLLTRVGINRRRSTSEEDILYSLEVLNEVPGGDKQRAIYRSSILVEDDLLADLLVQFIKFHKFYFGGAISRGLGKVSIQAIPIPINPVVASQIEKFNQKLRQRWQVWNVFGNPQEDLLNNRSYFTLNLLADAILTENWQRTTVISPKMLCEFAAIDDPSLTLHVAYSSYDYRSGWNSAWGLMKDMELIVNKGSVYLFSTSQLNPWISALENLCMQGVGERTKEGFGQVQVCHPFHQILREEAV
jgi:CRISPR-associated protein Csx10